MSIEDGVDRTLRGLSEIADEGGYIERKEALQTIAQMQWFDNFGIEYYNHRLRITKTLADSVNDEDIPQIVQEELQE